MNIDEELLDTLFEQARNNPKLKNNLDFCVALKTMDRRYLVLFSKCSDCAVHKHPMSNENVILLVGKMDEMLFSEDGMTEVERIHLDSSTGNFGSVVPADTWHTVEVFEPSVIYEAKDGKYGEDGTVSLEVKD